MKKISFCLLLMVTVLMLGAGCSRSSNDDAASLLATVPADAASVVMVNMAHAVDRLGGKCDGATASLPDAIQKAIDKSEAVSPSNKRILREVLDGQSGVALNSFIFFAGARSYLTGMVNDPEKFVDYVKKVYPDLFGGSPSLIDEDGVKVMGKVVLVGNQFWICSDGNPDVDQLKYYQSLNEKQSYASSDAAELLLDSEKVASYVVDINRFLASMSDFGSARMAVSMLFSDAAYLAGNADFDGKTFLAEANVLDYDMKPSETLLPTQKIDTSIVKSLEGSAEWYAAADISNKFAEKISEAAAGFLGPIAKVITGPLKQIDGTVAIRLDSSAFNVEAKVQTTGKNFADIAYLLQNMRGLTVSRDNDNIVTVVKGTKDFTGPLSASEAADRMKGAWAGFVADGLPAKGMTLVVRLVPEKKSLRLNVEVNGGVDAILTGLLH